MTTHDRDARTGKAMFTDESLHLAVRIEAQLPMDDEAADDIPDERGVQAFEAAVVVSNGEENEREVGALRGFILRVDLIWDHGGSIPEVCDNHSATLAEYAEALFDAESNSFSEATERVAGDIDDPNVLIVDTAEIAVEYQGHGLGRRAVDTLVMTLGSGCGLVAIQPHPMQFGAYGKAHHESERPRIAAWRARYGVDRFVGQKVAAKKKLEAYWRRAGFTRVGRSSVFVKRTS